MVLESGFRPSFIVAIWPGGAPVGIAVQELLDYFGVHCDHIAIRTSSYRDIDGRHRKCVCTVWTIWWRTSSTRTGC